MTSSATPATTAVHTTAITMFPKLTSFMPTATRGASDSFHETTGLTRTMAL